MSELDGIAMFRGLTFNGGEGAARFSVEKFEGWSSGGVGVRQERTHRAGVDGEFPTDAFLTGRLTTVSGLMEASSPYDYTQTERQLVGLSLDEFSAFSAEGVWALMRPFEVPEVTPLVWGRVARYVLRLWSPSPDRFGAERAFPDGVVALNRGTRPAKPIHTVTGSHPGGYTVTNGAGRSVVVSLPLLAGVPHVIDMARGGLWVGGVRQINALASYQPWTIPPDGVGVTHTITPGLALSTSVTDTF